MDSRIETDGPEPIAQAHPAQGITICLYGPITEYGLYRTTTFRDDKPMRVSFDKSKKFAWQRYAGECWLYGVLVEIPASEFEPGEWEATA